MAATWEQILELTEDVSVRVVDNLFLVRNHGGRPCGPEAIGGRVSMSYFDDLSQGSKYHKAHLLSDGILSITVADIDDDECLQRFQGVLAEAEDEGYEVSSKHKYTQRGLPGWSGPVYDMAIVLRG
jgi:hypothetical protein